MSDLHLRPRTVSELVDAAFQLYRRHATLYVVAGAIAMTPVLLIQVFLPDARSVTGADAFTAGLLPTLMSWIANALISAVVMKIGSVAYLGGEPDLAVSLREVLPRIPRVLGTGALKLPLYFLGALALGCGMLYVMVRWFATATVVVLEDKGPIEAFGRSTELSKGRKRHILNTTLLVYLIYFILSMAVMAVAALLSGGGQDFASSALLVVVSTAFTVVAYPVVALTEMVLYYDARIRGEGFDLERMADALDPQPLGTQSPA